MVAQWASLQILQYVVKLLWPVYFRHHHSQIQISCNVWREIGFILLLCWSWVNCKRFVHVVEIISILFSIVHNVPNFLCSYCLEYCCARHKWGIQKCRNQSILHPHWLQSVVGSGKVHHLSKVNSFVHPMHTSNHLTKVWCRFLMSITWSHEGVVLGLLP